MDDRQKVLYVSKKMKEKRQETIKRITSDYGTQLRMNRSIQAEGSFANIKEDMEFRRYLYRGKANVTAQSILLAIGYNVNKLHHKIQAGIWSFRGVYGRHGPVKICLFIHHFQFADIVIFQQFF